jgi:glycosyltransferase involved in cell wall biosynthesis
VNERFNYGVVTPARDEVDNLARLADSMIEQTTLPSEWVIVDHGSTDGTGSVSKRLAEQHDWIRAVMLDGEPTPTRGGPIVQAFMAGLAEMEGQSGALDGLPDVVIKIDADISFPPDHFECLVGEFARDPKLGIASSTCWELEGGEWRPQHVARHHVRGAVRAYRRDCLRDVMPLEPRMGWDTIDEVKAQLAGWTTRSVADLPFYHHRITGERDGGRRSWESQGALAWYLGYRVSYLVLRTAFRVWHDRSALAILKGWMRAGLHREPRYPDPEVRRFLRREQSLLRLPLRAREVLGWQRRESTQ